MNMGEKIQQLRKKEGLSQEALAERLGLSRQAVSKWESGTAIPSIDNLVELSKIFAVTVGELLQLEQASPAGSAAAPSGPSADRIEDSAERPARDGQDRENGADDGASANENADANVDADGLSGVLAYLKEQESLRKDREKRSRVATSAVAVVAAACLIAGGIFLAGRVNLLNSRISNMESRIDAVNGNLTGQINAVTENVKEQLGEPLRIAADYTWEQIAVDTKAMQATLHVTALPKAYKPGMTAVFTAAARGEEPVTAAGTLSGDNRFSCDITVPLNDEVRLSVGLTSGEITENQFLETIFGLRRGNVMEVTGRLDGAGSVSFVKDGGTADIGGTFVIKVKPVYGTSAEGYDIENPSPVNWPVKAKVLLYAGDQIVKRYPVDLSGMFDEKGIVPDGTETGEEFISTIDTAYFYVEVPNEQFRLNGAESLRAVAAVTDNFGFTRETEIWAASRAAE